MAPDRLMGLRRWGVDIIIGDFVDIFDDYEWYIFAFGAFMCMLSAALAAGLTMGYMSIDKLRLEVMLKSNPDDAALRESEKEIAREEKRQVERISPLLSWRHRLLVTLLLVNSLANEALPLFLDECFSPIVALVISVTAVLFFGEIFPTAVFAGPQQYRIAAAFAPLLRVVQVVFYPIAVPIAKVLDRLVGHEDDPLNRAEVKALLGHLASHQALGEQERRMMVGAVSMHNEVVKSVVLPLEKVYMVEMDQVIDDEWVSKVVAMGHSRVPVFERSKHNIRGVILIKRLIALAPGAKRTVRSVFAFYKKDLLSPSTSSGSIDAMDSIARTKKSATVRPCAVISPNATMAEALKVFSTGESHIALVAAVPRGTAALNEDDSAELVVKNAWRNGETIPASVHILGFLFLEDVMEKILHLKIEDEDDADEVGAWRPSKKTHRKTHHSHMVHERSRPRLHSTRVIEAHSGSLFPGETVAAGALTAPLLARRSLPTQASHREP